MQFDTSKENKNTLIIETVLLISFYFSFGVVFYFIFSYFVLRKHEFSWGLSF